jgi:hypothetical protein
MAGKQVALETMLLLSTDDEYFSVKKETTMGLNNSISTRLNLLTTVLSPSASFRLWMKSPHFVP